MYIVILLVEIVFIALVYTLGGMALIVISLVQSLRQKASYPISFISCICLAIGGALAALVNFVNFSLGITESLDKAIALSVFTVFLSLCALGTAKYGLKAQHEEHAQ